MAIPLISNVWVRYVDNQGGDQFYSQKKETASES